MAHCPREWIPSLHTHCKSGCSFLSARNILGLHTPLCSMVRHRWMHNWRLSYLKRKRRFKSIGSNPSPQYIQNVSNHQLIQYHSIGIYQYDGHIIFAAGLFCKYLWNFISMIFLCSVSCFYMYSLQCMHLEHNCSSLLFCSTTYFSLVCLYQLRCSISTGKEPDFLSHYNMVLYRSVLSLCFLYMLLERFSNAEKLLG